MSSKEAALSEVPERVERVQWCLSELSGDQYVLLPGSVYAGNRFASFRLPYSPRAPEDLASAEMEPIVNDVPRLATRGSGGIYQLSGDVSIPLVAVYDPLSLCAWAVIATQGYEDGGMLLAVEENESHTELTIRLERLGVRPSPVYRLPMFQVESPDPMPHWERDSKTAWKVESCQVKNLPEFFLWIQAIMAKHFPLSDPPACDIPFSEAVSEVVAHYHRDFWDEELGLFATSEKSSPYYFQTGWCGGMIATWPLLQQADETAQQKAKRNLMTFFSNARSPSGLFYGKCSVSGKWEADFAHDTSRPYTNPWHLIRRDADMMFYLPPQLRWLSDNGHEVPEQWREALRDCAVTVTEIWKKNGQMGHFVHQDSGKVLVGGTTSAGLMPAGLWHCAQYFDLPEFKETAIAMGEHFWHHHVAKGVTCGGVGDALMAPDSESSYAVVESFIALYEATNEGIWLERAKVAGALFSTWVMPYPYHFPAASEFGKLNLNSTGTIFANAQNKHSAPGICTHSGLALLKLFRATGDEVWIRCLANIRGTLPQFVSRIDRPIHDKAGKALPSGWINERVNTSDWDDNIGGVFCGPCWSEVSLLLSYYELPGLYVSREEMKLWKLEHVEAEFNEGVLIVRNPFDRDMTLQILCETTVERNRPLPENLKSRFQSLKLGPKEQKAVL